MTKKKSPTLESVARLILNRPSADSDDGRGYGHGNSQASVRARITLKRVPWLSRTIPFWDLPAAEWMRELDDRKREAIARRSRKTVAVI